MFRFIGMCLFECPSCREQLSLSDSYQNVMRFVAAFGFCSLILCTILLLKDWVPSNLVSWLTFPVSYGIGTSALFLYRRAFTPLFPPKVQRGTPYFITLNLEGKVATSRKRATVKTMTVTAKFFLPTPSI